MTPAGVNHIVLLILGGSGAAAMEKEEDEGSLRLPAAVRIGRAPGHCDFGDSGGVQDPMLRGCLLGGKKEQRKWKYW